MLGTRTATTDQLRTYLTAIKTFLTAFPEQEPLIALRDVTFSCRTDGPACLEAEASLRRREIQGRFRNGRKDVWVPLYVVAPSEQRRTFPRFGFPPSRVRIFQ